MDDLTGKVALVTGASRGIGRAISLALAEAGASVVVNYRARAAEAEEVTDAIRAMGRPCLCVQADVSTSAGVDQLARAVESGLGPVEILVNNAGIARPQPVEEITPADWHEIIAVNLTSCFLLTQAVLPSMRQRRWGRIINLSSVAAQLGGVIGPHYAASKAGLHGLTHFYARRFAPEGITANVIAPALIETEMVTSNPNANPGLIPVGRYGVPDEVSSVAVLLAQNGYITGQTISVNGGWYMT
ncbi:MAG: 3-oxoacyl-ACP reductase FabG [Acidobacteria bacterium]|nr:3-oxoacyl-ACP reductase FabG [Acidobacteriota bacterium]